ncbi:IS481 family transposase [Rhodanobacter sp. B05]|uniref:IS481 family transposase n=1 Tax=Rhodanobacter sp. B05 TaxID=1945859 RepID=UPI000987C950|nr:IS481 family transposase [Rhodanobacter sp. B05]OOG53324.1 IS481 family transposase [Rhodanobacter sp. B05]
MPWKETTSMSLRNEFTALAKGHGVSMTELARRFGISRKTAYKWLSRDAANEPLSDRSRRPHSSPTQTTGTCEQAVVLLRQKYPQWGGRKLHRVLLNNGHLNVPAPSTITHILRRHGLMPDKDVSAQGPWKRFEHALPNDLWQMDFKGTIAIGEGRCDPLTVLDDHSRYSVILRATPDMRGATVQAALTEAFRRYGMPVRMNMDNGSPWGSPGGDSRGLSALSLWLVRLGIRVSFSAPAHPQTNGKEERFHRSLKAEVLAGRVFTNHAHAQQAFDAWRDIYNTVRPHEGIGMAVPSDRYRPSPRPLPEALPAIEYAPQDTVVTVLSNGIVKFKGNDIKVSNALRGLPIAFRPDDNQDGIYTLYFAHHRLASIDMREAD